MNVDKERNRESVRRWYRSHSEEYNTKRRDRYSKDPSIREKAQLRAKLYRDSKRNGRAIERELYRTVNGSNVQVYTSGQVAEIIGRTPQMLRNWQSNGWIPQPSIPGKHRLYTDNQVDLIDEFNTTLMDAGGAKRITVDGIQKLSSYVYDGWSK